MVTVDRAAFARWCLELELFGPAREQSATEIANRCDELPPAEAQELREILSSPVTDRHIKFRQDADNLSRLYGQATSLIVSSGGHVPGLGTGTVLNGWTRATAFRKWMDRQPNADESDTTVAVAITKVTESVESILKEIAPSLIELSWTCDWLLRVARQGHQISDLAFERDGLLLSELPQTSLVAELHLPDTYGVGFGDITVDRPDSKKLARERLARAALDRLDAVANEVPRGEWTTRVARSLAEIAIDEVLDEEYPSGQRHYALDWRPQIRRDVALWVRRNLDDESSIDIATDAAVRAEDDPLFVVRTGGSRPRVPTTERGVREAIKRAQALLA